MHRRREARCISAVPQCTPTCLSVPSYCYDVDMAISIMRGPTVTSLEFNPKDKDAVKAVIRELYGDPKVISHGIVSTVQVDGEEFTYQNEWDDPCLITSTVRGAGILQLIADKLAKERT